MKNIYNKLSDNIIVIFLLSLVLFVIVPLVIISYYNVPGASDDVFHAVFQVKKNYFEGVYKWYLKGYNGRYANAFFMQIPGRIFMYKSFAKIFPVVVMISMYIATYFLFSQYTTRSKKTLLWSVLFTTYVLAYMPDLEQVYWYSGITVYVLPLIFFMFLLGFYINIYKQQVFVASQEDTEQQQYLLSKKQKIAIGVLAFFTIGSSEIWMAIAASTTALFYLDAWLKQRKIKNVFFLPMLLAVIFAALIVFSPGTTHRLQAESDFVNNGNIIGSFVTAFISFGKYFQAWFVQLGIGLIVLFVLVSKPLPKRVRLFSALSLPQLLGWFFIVLLFSLFIVRYSLGHLEVVRERALVPMFVYASLFFLFLLYSYKTNVAAVLASKIKGLQIHADIFLGAGFLFLMVSSYNVQVVYDDLLRGKPELYESQVDAINKYIAQHEGDSISLPAFTCCPKTFTPIAIPKERDWYYWPFIMYHKLDDITLNENITMEDFIDIYTNGKGVKVYNKNPYYDISTFSRKALTAKQQQSIHVKARMRKSKKNKGIGLLVFECHPYWKGVRLDTIMKGNVLDFKWTLPQETAFKKDKLKVYFYNPDTVPIFIQKAESNTY